MRQEFDLEDFEESFREVERDCQGASVESKSIVETATARVSELGQSRVQWGSVDSGCEDCFSRERGHTMLGYM